MEGVSSVSMESPILGEYGIVAVWNGEYKIVGMVANGRLSIVSGYVEAYAQRRLAGFVCCFVLRSELKYGDPKLRSMSHRDRTFALVIDVQRWDADLAGPTE
jgi:hypothetical protein